MKPLIRTLAVLGFAGAMLSWTGPASAQQACATHDDTTKQLENQFDERIIGRGLASGESWQQLPLLIGDPA